VSKTKSTKKNETVKEKPIVTTDDIVVGEDVEGVAEPTVDDVAADAKDEVKTKLAKEPVDEIDKFWERDGKKKVTVKNISNVDMYFLYEMSDYRFSADRIEILIPARQSKQIAVEELINKFQNQNPSICGVDGLGNHATLFIENVDLRKYFGFEKQQILSPEKINEMFKIDKFNEFERAIRKNVVSLSEKLTLVEIAKAKFKDGSLDSASKIKFIEQYTDETIDE